MSRWCPWVACVSIPVVQMRKLRQKLRVPDLLKMARPAHSTVRMRAQIGSKPPLWTTTPHHARGWAHGKERQHRWMHDEGTHRSPNRDKGHLGHKRRFPKRCNVWLRFDKWESLERGSGGAPFTKLYEHQKTGTVWCCLLEHGLWKPAGKKRGWWGRHSLGHRRRGHYGSIWLFPEGSSRRPQAHFLLRETHSSPSRVNRSWVKPVN